MQIRKLVALLLLLISCLLLSGCSDASEVENQAYALIMGVDKIVDEDMIELTIRIPKIGSPDGNSDSESSGGARSGSYLVLSAKGDTYAQALEYLQWAATRELNLSQIKLLVVSEVLARDADFSKVSRSIAQTPRLYTAARFVVCEGSAKDFITGQETVIGTRLSTEIEAMFEHLESHGYIPQTTFADVYYELNSIYSDPVAIWGFPSEEPVEEDSQPVSLIINPQENADAMVESPSSRYYMGSVIFRDNVLALKMNAAETLFTNLINGNFDTFTYAYQDKFYNLSSVWKVKKTVDFEGNQTHLGVKLSLSSVMQIEKEVSKKLEEAIEENLRETIQKCQSLRLDPFGFSEKAARKFLTIDEWKSFNWRDKYAEADLDIEVIIHHANS